MPSKKEKHIILKRLIVGNLTFETRTLQGWERQRLEFRARTQRNGLSEAKELESRLGINLQIGFSIYDLLINVGETDSYFKR